MPYYHTQINDTILISKIKKRQKKFKNNSLKYALSEFICYLKERSRQIYLTLQTLTNSSYWNIFNFISIIAFCLILSSPLILVPQHNAIKTPKYWYEGIIVVQFSYTITATLYRMMSCKILFSLECFTSYRSFLLIYSTQLVSMVMFTLAYFVIFVLYLHYDPPLPFGGIIGYLSYYVSATAIWYSIPHEKRIEPLVRKQFKVYLAYIGFNHVIFSIVFKLYTMIFKEAPADMQWIVGIGLPIIREVGSWLRVRMLHLAFDEKSSNLINLIGMNVGHTFYVSVALGTFATEFTGYIVLSIDFATNIYNAIRISRLYAKINSKSMNNAKSSEEKRIALTDLALVEIIEFIVPLVYIITLIVALFGPNSSILGNYGNGYWTYRKIESLDKYVFTAIEMFAFDFCSFIVTGLILWKYCSVNFFLEICKQMKTSWLLIAITLAKSVNTVSAFL